MDSKTLLPPTQLIQSPRGDYDQNIHEKKVQPRRTQQHDGHLIHSQKKTTSISHNKKSFRHSKTYLVSSPTRISTTHIHIRIPHHPPRSYLPNLSPPSR